MFTYPISSYALVRPNRREQLSQPIAIELRVSGTEEDEETVPHFLLVGDRAFRQEAGHRPFTSQTVFSDTEPHVSARIDFDDPQTGKLLTQLFDKLWGGA